LGLAVQGGSIAFYDIAGQSPTIRVGRAEQGREMRSAQRVGHLAWTDIDALISECFPSAPSLPGQYPAVSHLYVDAIEIGPFVTDGEAAIVCSGNVAIYGHALAKIGYSTLPYEAATLITRRWSIGGEFLTLPPNSLYWEVSGNVVEEEDISAAKQIPTIEHSILRHRATSIPWAAIKDNIGKVNNATLNNSYFTNVAAETLLYLGAEVNYSFNTDGTQIFTYEHRFRERQVKDEVDGESQATSLGWNHFLNPSTAKWDRLTDEFGDPVHPLSGTFTALFS
jgi:hypothetical protein